METSTTEQVRSAAVERLFYVTLIVAIIHAGFILWDLITMALGIKNDVVASNLMNNLYLILIGGYAGFVIKILYYNYGLMMDNNCNLKFNI